MERMIKTAADRIRNQSGANKTTEASELNRLRDEIKRLERSQEELRKRLEKVRERRSIEPMGDGPGPLSRISSGNARNS